MCFASFCAIIMSAEQITFVPCSCGECRIITPKSAWRHWRIIATHPFPLIFLNFRAKYHLKSAHSGGILNGLVRMIVDRPMPAKNIEFLLQMKKGFKMYNKQPSSDLGNTIKKIVNDALHASHIEELKDVGDLVFTKQKKASSSSGQSTASTNHSARTNADSQNQSNAYGNPPPQAKPPKNARAGKKQSYSYAYQYPASSNGPPAIPKPVRRVPFLNAAGVLMLVFGVLGTGIFAALSVFMLLSIFMQAGLHTMYLIAPLPFLLASFVLMLAGFSLVDRNRRFRRYETLCAGKRFYFIEELSSHARKKPKALVRDLKAMIRLGYLPDGHLDAQNTCLMLDAATYQQYLHADEEMKRQQLLKKQKPQLSGNAELDKTIKSGQDYIRRIREANRLIPGEEISRKISHLDDVTGKIFDCVARHPEKLPELRKFMNYYLPTTLKLLDAYVNFEQQSVPTENVKTAKKEIDGALDNITLAFENLLNNLFHDETLDISTDISALEAMLAQEGLTEQDFKNIK